MKIRFKLVVICSLVLFATINIMGCADKEIYDRSTFDDTICPDQYIAINEAYLSSGIDDNMIPVDITDIFTTDTPTIYFTFELSGDLCCIQLTVEWKYEGERIGDIWSDDGSNVITPFTLAIHKPESGFPKGNYTVTLYSTIWGTTIPFTVR